VLRQSGLRRLSQVLHGPLLREEPNLLRRGVLQSWFDLLRQQDVLPRWECLLQRQMLLHS